MNHARKPKDAEAAAIIRTKSGAQIEVRYGDVSVLVPTPTAGQLKRNVTSSTRVMSSLEQTIIQRGVKLVPKKGVPLYSVDARDPSVMVRILNGTKEKGHLVDGVFKPIRAIKPSAAV